MVSQAELAHLTAKNPDTEFVCCVNINLYDSQALERLATQAVAGRQLRIVSSPPEIDGLIDCLNGENGDSGGDSGANPDIDSRDALQVRLCEDDYPGWISVDDLSLLDQAETPYQPALVSEAEIRDRLPRVISYAQLVMQQPNYYLWGGTVGPNYDCSGLMQAAFLSVGVWIPRDAYQQEAFTRSIALEAAEPGDLVFFGTPERTTHVGLYLGDRHYIHSSGKEIGRNGIGIDQLSDIGDPVSQAYFKQFKGIGRVVMAYPGSS